MGKSIFSKESLDRISSPEQLNDYVKVATPGMWMILGSIIVLLIGAIAWGVLGEMDSTLNTCVISKDGQATCYVRENDISRITVGQEVRISEKQYKVTDIAATPVQVKGNFTDYEKHVGGLSDGEWVYEVSTDADLKEGVTHASIVTEIVSPISFILN